MTSTFIAPYAAIDFHQWIFFPDSRRGLNFSCRESTVTVFFRQLEPVSYAVAHLPRTPERRPPLSNGAKSEQLEIWATSSGQGHPACRYCLVDTMYTLSASRISGRTNTDSFFNAVEIAINILALPDT